MTFYGNDSFGGIANKTQNFEVVAQYQFDDFNLPLRPSVAYLQSKGKDLYAYSRYGDKDLVKYVDVGMTYYFNKNMSTYVDYKINLLDEDDRFYKNSGIATDDIVALGWSISSDPRQSPRSAGFYVPAPLRSLFSTLPLSRRTFPLYDAFKLVRAKSGDKVPKG